MCRNRSGCSYLFRSLTKLVDFALHVFAAPDAEVLEVAKFVNSDGRKSGKPENSPS